MQETAWFPAARTAFWIAVVLGVLAVAAMYFDPIEGAVYAALLFGAAWGIHRGQAWAAIALACLLVPPLIASIFLARQGASAITVLYGLIACQLAYWPMRAAVKLYRQGPASRRLWPWIAVVLACVCAWLGLGSYQMPSGSMEKTILAGDRLFIETASWRLGRAPSRGDLLVFRYPADRKQVYIKRVVGLPGDRLHFVNKRLYRNGAAVPEPYATHTASYVDAYRDNFPSQPNVILSGLEASMLRDNVRDGEVIVPQGAYFVLGDNRDDSLDSRYFGFVPRGDILGSPLLIYGSYDLKGEQPGRTRATVLHMRWNRLLRGM